MRSESDKPRRGLWSVWEMLWLELERSVSSELKEPQEFILSCRILILSCPPWAAACAESWEGAHKRERKKSLCMFKQTNKLPMEMGFRIFSCNWISAVGYFGISVPGPQKQRDFTEMLWNIPWHPKCIAITFWKGNRKVRAVLNAVFKIHVYFESHLPGACIVLFCKVSGSCVRSVCSLKRSNGIII